MSSEKKPAEFDWVTARYECSASVMFSKLRRDAETNIDRRNEQLGRSSPARFSLESDNDSFFVKRGDFCVGFRMDKSAGRFCRGSHARSAGSVLIVGGASSCLRVFEAPASVTHRKITKGTEFMSTFASLTEIRGASEMRARATLLKDEGGVDRMTRVL